MNNLHSKIKGLKKSTGSLKTKEVCDKTIARLSEIYEMNVTHSAKLEVFENIFEVFMNELEELKESDKATVNFIKKEKKNFKINNLGVKETFQKIMESDLKAHPTIKMVLEGIRNEIQKPEYLTCESYISRLRPFNWHPTIKSSIERVESNISENRDEIYIQRALFELENSNSSYIITGFKNELNEYLANKTKANKEILIEKLNKFAFDTKVRNLISSIRESKDNEFYVQTNKDSTIVENVHSLVYVNENSEVFGIGNDFYLKEGNNISLIPQDKTKKLPNEFVTVSNILANPSVKVNENNITVYLGKKKFVITENKIAVDGKEVTDKEFKRIYLNESLFNPAEVNNMKTINLISEKFSEIVNIEFAKRLTAPNKANRQIDIIKIDENIYLHQKDPVMGTTKFYEGLNATQTKNIFSEFMNYDISESFTDLLDVEESKIREIEETKKVYIETISEMEEKLSELKTLDIGSVVSKDQYNDIVETLESELEELKNEYNSYVAEAEKMVASPDEMGADTDFKVGETVHCHKTDGKVKITDIDGVTGNITVVDENGESFDCKVEELETISPIPENVDEKIKVTVDGKEIEIEGSEDSDDGEDGDSDDEEDGDSDDKEDDKYADKIDEPLGESIKAGTEVELEDGRRGIIQDISNDEVTVMTDEGDTVKTKESKCRVVGSPGLSGQQNDGSSVQIEEGAEILDSYYATGKYSDGSNFHLDGDTDLDDLKSKVAEYGNQLDQSSIVYWRRDANGKEIKLDEFVNESYNKNSLNENNYNYIELSNGETTVSLYRDGGKWHEDRVLAGEKPYGWGQKTYMSYLNPNEIADYLSSDYSGHWEVVLNENMAGMFIIDNQKRYLHVSAEDVEQYKRGGTVYATDEDGKEYEVNKKNTEIIKQ